jgi:hypothetical protein
MAIVKVNGSISRTFFDGKGAEVVESWQQGGETRTKRWAAFFEQPHGLSEGDQVEVSGMHGDKVDQWEKEGQTMHTIKRTLNKARVDGSASSSATSNATNEEPWAKTAPAQTEAAQGDVWNKPGNYNDETPFG